MPVEGVDVGSKGYESFQTLSVGSLLRCVCVCVCVCVVCVVCVCGRDTFHGAGLQMIA